MVASKPDESVILKGEGSREINIAILGVPGEKIGNPAPYLTDTILIAKLRLVSGKISNISLISLPRDLYVKVPQSDYFTKINALYMMGRERFPASPEVLILQKLREISGLQIDYFTIFDLNSVKEIIDSLDGVTVLVEEDIYDPQFPTENFGTEAFEMKKGWQHMDGITAVKYARTRHTIEGDLGRMKRQQQVIDGLRKKIFALNLFWDLNKIMQIYETVQDNLITNFSEAELQKLWFMAKDVPFDSISNIALGVGQQEPLIKESHEWMGGVQAFVFVPVEGTENYQKIKEFIIRQ
jgi:LCP family protein required for cell wall assembly